MHTQAVTNTPPVLPPTYTISEKLASFNRPISIKELAGILGVSKSLVRKQVAVAGLPCFRFGSSVRFEPKLVLAWFARQ